jgi:hypothetical protein
MKNTKKILLAGMFLITGNLCAKGYSPHMITFFFKNYPAIEKKGFKKVPLGKKNPRSGIFVSYFGYMTTSDKTGEIMFPRKHQSPSFSLLVCDNPEPVFMLQNTIHHWQVTKNAKFAFYTIERKKDNETQLYFWDVKKSDLPKNKHLPVNSLVVFADPDDLYVPEGVTLTNNKPQLFLPPLYAKPSSSSPRNALAALQIRTFFDPIQRVYKVGKGETQSHTNTL